MAALLCTTYLAIAALAGFLAPHDHDEPGSVAQCRTFALWALCSAFAFFLPFFIIGSSELIFGWPRVSIVAVLLVQLVVMTLLLLWNRKAVQQWWNALSRWRFSCPNRRDPIVGLTLVALFVFVSVGLMLTSGFPRGYEVTAYHLPIAVHYFQAGSLRPWDHQFLHTYPANMSILTGFLLQFLPERLVSIANLPFLIVTSFAVFGLARAQGASARSSLLAAVGITSIPIVAFSALELGADLAGIAFLGCAFLIYLTAPSRSMWWPAAAGAAAGLAYGFKSLHLVGSAALGLVILYQALTPPDEAARRRLQSALRLFTAYASGFILTGGFWLARNWFELGNPLYPVHLGPAFDLLGWNKAPDVTFLDRAFTQFEWVRSEWEWMIYPWLEWHDIAQNFKHSSGLGAFFAVGVPLAIGVTAVGLIARATARQRAQQPASSIVNSAILLFSVLIIVAVWWILGDRQPRYVMGALVLAVPLLAPVTDSLRGAPKQVMQNVLLASALLMFFVIISKQTAEFGSRFLVSKQTGRSAFYEYPSVIDRLPEHSVVLNLGPRPQNYPALGKSLSNKVISEYHAATETGDGEGRLTATGLLRLGVTHVYTYGPLAPRVSGCLVIRELDRLDRNPANDHPLPEPRIVYAIDRCVGER